ncbi:MAG TPA: type II secretion system secretin GspD [Gammaproteobacteria bacterium]|nr:type II secretion system secretin GspD [Gammaproteobacteria bacterium]
MTSKNPSSHWWPLSTRRAHYFRNLLAGLLLVSPLAFAEPVTLNFKDADIQAVISTVAEITGKNFIVDPRVNGKVTIISSRPMDKDEIYQVFLSLLEVHGFATVPAGGNAIKIIPDANAKFNNIPTATDAEPGSGDEIITRVIEVNKVQAAQLVPILRPLISPQGHMAAFPQNNLLVVSDRAANTERLAQIIRRIDQPSTDQVEIIPLQYASAAELVRILTTLEQQASRNDPSAKQTTLIADDRTNSILVSGDKGDRLRIRATISHLDTPIQQSGGNIHVVYLRYAKAKDLVPVLTGISAGKDKGGSVLDGGAAPPPVTPTQPTQPEGGAPPPPAPFTNTGTPPVNGGASKNIPLSIQADESTNALVITASPDAFRALEGVIRQLDVRRAQVAVEAVIAEVTSDKANELGIQWRFSGGEDSVGTIGNAAIASGDINLSVPSSLQGLTLGFFRGNGVDLRALIRAIASDSDANLLSTPTLITMDNQEAEIVVGQNVPFVTGSFTNTGATTGATNPFQTIQRQDVGLKLKIKPQVNEGDAVKLEIEQEVSSIAPGTTGASDLITNKRSIKTVVTVDDGKIVVLGGLIDDNLTESVQKVPFLGDVPVLGALFRNTRTTRTKRNLMVFLHPVILRDPVDSARLANSKYNFIRAKQLETAQDGVALMPDETSPALPPIDEFLTLPPPFPESSSVEGAPPGANAPAVNP